MKTTKMLSKFNNTFVKTTTNLCNNRNNAILCNSFKRSTNLPKEKINPVVYNKMYNVLKSTHKKIEDLDQKYQRIIAESAEMCARLEKYAAEQRKFGIQSFCCDFLAVADNINYATAAVPKEELAKNPHLKRLFQGLCRTQKHFARTLKRHGVRALNPINSKFDPHYHEALFTCVDDCVEPNTVIDVVKVGYKLHDRCIRPALVGVSKLA